jgi:hypothetical protein
MMLASTDKRGGVFYGKVELLPCYFLSVHHDLILVTHFGRWLEFKSSQ